MVIYYIVGDEKSNITLALTYTTMEILNVKRATEKNCQLFCTLASHNSLDEDNYIVFKIFKFPV